MINIMPEFLNIGLAVKLQIGPANMAMLIALGLCVALAWSYYQRRRR